MYDLIIIGGGCAGMAAGIYAARYNLKTLIISKETGGVLNEAHLVENWPGERSIPGADLMVKFKEHAEGLGVDFSDLEVEKIEKKDNEFIVTSGQESFQAKALILAWGLRRRHLNIPGEDEFAGRGVSYCYTCDAPFFKEKVVGVVGGSDSAALASLLSAQYAKKVYIIYRKDELRAEPVNKTAVEGNEKIEMIYNTNITEVKGSKFLTTAILDKPFNGSNELQVDGLFIEVGSVPSTVLAEQIGVKLDKSGLIIVDKNRSTNVEGVFAAGDSTDTVMKQAITAAADGAIAALGA
ncbi:MAG: FAD-dependent oxidoreductase, partial [Nanoarchaeota archaeon]|nr:FAD-dependent oxidoreductase [Nanoarchaeota archaeon]